ncbi:hypothetical protein PybrP1_007589 [[Pythium] brassicae (nom. inval.)]|nr:hypothetical protein PybrP1_007589 [[Pythium] brassicae (nom. inval.)]
MDKRTARKVHADDFTRTLRAIRERYLREHARQKEPAPLGNDQIHVYVRKRPLLPHEIANHEFDVISSIGEREIVIHECKMYNDMRHKYIVSHHQRFSTCYDELVDTEAYIAEDLFTEAVGSVDFSVSVSAIEIAGSKCFDLINNRGKVLVCEDGDGSINLLNATETDADSTNALLGVLEAVKSLRTTESTSVNSQSSRSHLVCYVNLRRRAGGELYGQLVLLDLAGSERNADSFHHGAARRKETIEINKSHLALKECVRAIGREDATGYVPYRASTLTRILKGCLWSKRAKASVVATVSPLSVDTEHTLHTLLCAGQMLEDAPHVGTEREDVPEEDEGDVVVPVREWDNPRVRLWVGAVRHGAFAKYAGNLTSAVDGRLLVRFSLARFKQLCDGNAEAAAHLLKALRDEMAEQEKLLKAKRAHTAARNGDPRK